MPRVHALGLLKSALKAVTPKPVRVKARTLLARAKMAGAGLLTKGARASELLLLDGRDPDEVFLSRSTGGALSHKDLRSLNQLAVTALNDVDIAGSIRNALPGALLSGNDDDVEKLEIKEQACFYLAIALIQGLGRLDEAVFWWRTRRRAAAAIVRHRLAKHGVVPDPRNLIFDQFWSAYLGHTAMLGIHAKKNILSGNSRHLMLVRPPPGHKGNPCLLDHWRKYFELVDDASKLDVPADCVWLHSKFLFVDECLTGADTYFWQVYAEVSREWEKAGRGALLQLSPPEIERGQAALAAMGVPRGAWYACLHVRSPGFKLSHESLQFTLNADIATYDLAIDAIVQRGGWVIRIGDPSMPKLPARHGVVDYAHSPRKADWMDVFLFATCRFYVGTSSGPAYAPNLFGTPSVATNWFPTGTRPLNSSDIFLPKLHVYKRMGEPAPFAESLAPPLGHIHAMPTLDSLGVSIRDNSPDELRDAVVEMLERLEGTAAYTAEDDRLQARFDSVATNARSFGNARIGRDFIRKYRSLLPC